MVAELNPYEKTVAPPAELWSRRKMGSVIPRRRKLIKRLVLESILESVVSLCSSSPRSASACSSNMFNKKDYLSFPEPDGFSHTHQKNQSSEAGNA